MGPARGGGSTSGSGSAVATVHTPSTTTSGGAGPGSHHRARTRWQPGQDWRGSRRWRRWRPAQHSTVASQVQEGKEGIRFQQDVPRRRGGGPWGAAADAQKMPAEHGRQHFPRGCPGAARHKDGTHSHTCLLTMYKRLPCPTHQHHLQQVPEALCSLHCGKERASGAGSGTAGGRAGAAGGQRGASGARRKEPAFRRPFGSRGLPGREACRTLSGKSSELTRHKSMCLQSACSATHETRRRCPRRRTCWHRLRAGEWRWRIQRVI